MGSSPTHKGKITKVVARQDGGTEIKFSGVPFGNMLFFYLKSCAAKPKTGDTIIFDSATRQVKSISGKPFKAS